MSWFTKVYKLFKKALLRGEWFLEDSGNAIYSDGDIGDINHEMAAMQSKIPEELWDKYESGTLNEDERFEIGEDFLQHMEKGGEAREWMITHEGWIRVHDSNFELWQLNETTLSNIINFLGEELQNDFDDEENDTEIYVSEMSTGRIYNFWAKQLFNAQDSGSLARLLMRRKEPGIKEQEKAQKLQIEHQNLLMNEGMNLLQQVKQQYGTRYNIISGQLHNKSPQNINSQISFWRMLLQKYNEFSKLDDNQFVVELQNILQYY